MRLTPHGRTNSPNLQETKGSESSQSHPDSPMKGVCIKQLGTFKNTESYKKFYLFTSLNHWKISAGIMTRNQETFPCIIIKRQNVLLHFYISIHIHREWTASRKSSTPRMVLWWRVMFSAGPLPIVALSIDLAIFSKSPQYTLNAQAT